MAKMTPAQRVELEKVIKRVNERYADLVRKGVTDSYDVRRTQELMNRISTVSVSKSDKLKIGKPLKMTEEDIKVLRKLDKANLTWGEAVKRVTERVRERIKYQTGEEAPSNFKPTTDQIKEELAREEDTHELIKAHAQEIYNASARITGALKRSGRLTVEEEDTLWQLYHDNFPAENLTLNEYLEQSLPQ